MMRVENSIKWMLFAFLSIFLVACKPTAKFDYSPAMPSTGEVIKFDATKSTVYKANQGNAIALYAWDFGDGTKATGKTVEHSYTKAGQYTVILNITDLAGQTSSTTEKINVKQGSASINQEVSAIVQSSNGTRLANAKVTIQGQSVTTDQNGVALVKFALPQGTKQVVAQFSKEGFINQSIVYDVANLKVVSANLLAVKQVIPVEDISAAQVIQSQYLHASIKIPANAFVKANGSLATGAVTVEFTPWNITNADLNAMPANGIAQDAQGNIVTLISAGMISAIFKDANGEYLQLAVGKTADIQMDLPIKSINNQEMKVGTPIPMWHFNETKGLWIEEGVGEVIASTESSTGLAVHATVSHFSTWNWDFKFENAGSVFVQCQSNGVGVPCEVNAIVTLNDGSKIYKYSFLTAQGVTVINMPSSGSIFWSAKDQTGTLVGEKNSGTTGNVIIELNKPTTDNFINCVLSDGTTVACSGKMNNQFEFSVSKDGGRLLTATTDLDGLLDWTAQTGLIFENNQWVRYTGKFTSGLSGNVSIMLTERNVIFDANQNVSFPVVCTTLFDGTEIVDPNVNWKVDPNLIGKPCKIIFEFHSYGDTPEGVELEFDSVYGEPIMISIPVKYFVDQHQNIEYSRYLIAQLIIDSQLGYSGYHSFENGVIPNSSKIIPLFLYLPH